MTFLTAIIAIATVPAIAVATLTASTPAPTSTPVPKAASHNSFARVGVVPPGVPAVATAGPWVWPLRPIPQVVRGFQVGPDPWSPGHRGVDLASRPGAPVLAPAGGVIRFSGMLAGRSVLAIDHGGGLISSFEPAIGRLPVGARVQPGDVVATLAPGRNHCSPATCLHWGVRRDGRYIDPLTLLPGIRGPAVLLPMLS